MSRSSSYMTHSLILLRYELRIHLYLSDAVRNGVLSFFSDAVIDDNILKSISNECDILFRDILNEEQKMEGITNEAISL